MSNESLKPQRREILTELKPTLKETDLVVAALAGTTAETYQVIDRPGNLYLVGMGMVSQVAFGLATALPSCRVFAFDTDGSMLLAPSILPVIGARQPKNLYIIVFDNEQLFGSRGGPQSQTATGADIGGIAKASGIEHVRTVRNQDSHSELALSWAARAVNSRCQNSSAGKRSGTEDGWAGEQVQTHSSRRKNSQQRNFRSSEAVGARI